MVINIKTSGINYNYENALYNRSWLKIKNQVKDYKGAIKDMEQLIIMDPYDIDLKIDLATFYSYDNKNNKAVKILDKAIKETPYEGNLYYWRGIYTMLGGNEPLGCRYVKKSRVMQASDYDPSLRC